MVILYRRFIAMSRGRWPPVMTGLSDESMELMTQETIHPPVQGRWHKEVGVKYLVALDVDGTLVDHDGHMSEEVKAAVQAVAREGHHVVISTGRSKGATLPIVELTGIERGYAVSSNGGVTVEIGPEYRDGYRVVDAVTFKPAKALAALGDRLPGAKFALEAADGSFYSTAQFQDRSFGMEAQQVSFEELLDLEAVRVVVFSTEIDLETFSEIIDEVGLHGVTYAVGWTPWLDIAASGVSKASALELIRRHLGVDPAHTVAMGDGHNDVEMLQWAARGVAMGQAPEEVISVATEVTESVYDDGAARILRTIVD